MITIVRQCISLGINRSFNIIYEHSEIKHACTKTETCIVYAGDAGAISHFVSRPTPCKGNPRGSDLITSFTDVVSWGSIHTPEFVQKEFVDTYYHPPIGQTASTILRCALYGEAHNRNDRAYSMENILKTHCHRLSKKSMKNTRIYFIIVLLPKSSVWI